MLQTPHKNLSRNFLRALIENRFISPSGKEYSPEEVTELYHEKSTRLADIEFSKLLREETKRHKKSWSLVEAARQITDFQDLLFKPKNRARESLAQKTLSTVDAISPNTKNYLNDAIHSDSIIEQQQGKATVGGLVAKREKPFDTTASPAADSITNKHQGTATMKKKKGFLTFNDVPAKNKRPASQEEINREIKKSLSYLQSITK